jgi:hypothetical protein
MTCESFRREDVSVVVPIREFVFVTVGSIVLSVVALAAIWPWTRHVRTLTAIGVAIAVGVFLWNVALNLTNASSLNVDSPVFGLSVQDVGSGVAAFVVTALVLRFVTDRAEPAARIFAVSAVVGIVTILVDLFG